MSNQFIVYITAILTLEIIILTMHKNSIILKLRIMHPLSIKDNDVDPTYCIYVKFKSTLAVS